MSPKPTGLYLGYIRVSSQGDRHDDRFHSPESQEKMIRTYAEHHNLQVEVLPPEIDVSGNKSKRPVLDSALARIDNGQAVGLIVLQIDRFARFGPATFYSLFEKYNILSTQENIDNSTPQGRAFRDIMLTMARMFMEIAAESSDRGRETVIESGKQINKVPPMGYTYKDDSSPDKKEWDRTLIPDPIVAPLITQVFERRATGEGPTSIAKWLNTQQSRQVSKATIQHIISNPIYKGTIVYGADKRFTSSHAHPIVDETIWYAAQPNGKRPKSTGKETEHLLTGVCVCSNCGHTMRATKDQYDNRQYACKNTKCDKHTWVSAKYLEPEAESIFWQITEDQEAQGTKAAVNFDAIQAQYDKAKTRFSYLQSDEAIDAYGNSHASKLKDARLTFESIAQELNEARTATATHTVLSTSMRDDYESMTMTDKNDLMRARFSAIVIQRMGSRTLTVRAIPNQLENEVWVSSLKTS